MQPDNQIVYEFIKKYKIGIISTVTSDFLPESAVVGIAVNEKLELFFGTYNTSRKYVNLMKNSRVAFVIGWDEGKTVQYEGQAGSITGEEVDEAFRTHLAKVPTAAKLVSYSERALFKVSPRWIRFSDVSKNLPDTIELTTFD